MYKIKDGFVLRKVGDDYVVVAEGAGQVNFNRMLRLNNSAAFLWNKIEGKEFDVSMLASLLVERYAIEFSEAKKDASMLISVWQELGVIE